MVSKRVARDGRNPRTGKVIRIPAARVPRFKPSRSLKSAIL
jgi:DNA-binding protein HU-beta